MPAPLVHRSDLVLAPDSARVVGRPHVPGDGPSTGGPPRLTRLVERVLELTPEQVEEQLQDVRERFGGRHRDLDQMLTRNNERVRDLLDGASAPQQQLVGAYLTQEHAFEAAALTNPSMVPAPDQSGVPAGSRRFLLSLRAISEGHISSITFRTGVVDGDGQVLLEPTSGLAETGERRGATYERRFFAGKLAELGAEVAFTARVLDRLPRYFGREDLEQAIASLPDAPLAVTHEGAKLMRWLASSNYVLSFDGERTDVAERLIWPEGPAESRGMEDARFVHFVETDSSTTYYATYTAFDGFEILPQLIETNDFARFEISTLSGPSAHNKGMALFPRQVDGDYVALSRPDRENIHLLRSSDPRAWSRPSVPLRRPQQPWEMIQMGNCGSPIETDEGWLVLTHGVGPMRTYRLGAMLLDLERPDRILADLPYPILEADGDERNGYVPNVVYSCGGMAHGDLLVLPYGASDQRTRIATLSLSDLLKALLEHPVDAPLRARVSPSRRAADRPAGSH